MSKILLNGDVDFNNKTAGNLAAPVNDTDVANKKYVDDIADGITEDTGESLNQKVNKSGDTMTGALTIGSGNLNVSLGAIDCYGAITSRNGIVKAQSFESGTTGSGVTVPSLTGVSSGASNYGWTSNVPIILPETQDNRNTSAVNKGYVDNMYYNESIASNDGNVYGALCGPGTFLIGLIQSYEIKHDSPLTITFNNSKNFSWDWNMPDSFYTTQADDGNFYNFMYTNTLILGLSKNRIIRLLSANNNNFTIPYSGFYFNIPIKITQ